MVKEGLINLDFADVRAIMRGMGKAMMGTGEATGENRANRAAEAAIANPLLDDVSMKGARGLLISITGGPDLTLYEVDEAATRIRGEVDHEANIILGATFDEGLEGIIRVSVVATGIDQALIDKKIEISATEQRIQEVAERLRQEARARAVTQPVPVVRPTVPVIDKAEPAPVAMAAAADPQPVVRDEVVFTPASPKQAVAFDPPPPPAPVVEEAATSGAPYVPPQADRVQRVRMPRIEELPTPAQAQIRAREAEPEKAKHMTLLQRLATVGFGRKEEAPAAPVARAPEAPRAPAPAAPAAPAPSPVLQEYATRPAAPVAPQGYRPAQGNLDAQGRAQPSARQMDDDQLEIPAFLRRQAN
jgi:cell division protein FtsZ